MFRTNLMTDWDMDICRLVFASPVICKTIGSIEPCNTHHKKASIFHKYSHCSFCCKCIIIAADKGKERLLKAPSVCGGVMPAVQKSLFMSSFVKIITHWILTISSDFNFLTYIYFLSPQFSWTLCQDLLR